MIDPQWRRIAGIACDEDGTIGAVWMAQERDTDKIHLYDACIFRREVMAVISEGINCRGRWIPVAWADKDKDISESLLEKGCNMLHDPFKDSPSLAEVASRDIWERMRTGRFKVDRRLSEWIEENKQYRRNEGKIPRMPLMDATRIAISQINYAKRQVPIRKQVAYPRINVL